MLLNGQVPEETFAYQSYAMAIWRLVNMVDPDVRVRSRTVGRHELILLSAMQVACAKQPLGGWLCGSLPELRMCVVYIRVCTCRNRLASLISIDLYRLRNRHCHGCLGSHGTTVVPEVREPEFHMHDRGDPDIPAARNNENSAKRSFPEKRQKDKERALPWNGQECRRKAHD